ncbi:MAG: acetyl-CoA C-acyltransferase [Gammaproteobacteria bacterium]
MLQDPIVITGAARTPQGNMLGSLSSLAAHELGSIAIQAATKRADIAAEHIEAAIMGCVLPAGQGQAPARQAALNAGLTEKTGATTINKMCGSGMQAVIMAHDALAAESQQVIVAGGMESMSNAPYLLAKARQGYRFGHGELKDHMLLDGLEDAYDKGKLMGYFADETAKKYHFSRETQDKFAQTSLERAIKASDDGSFAAEIVPVTINTRKGKQVIDRDEGPNPEKLSKISRLKPAFQKEGTVTAANSSTISDGASALILMRASTAKQFSVTPIAKICAHSSFAQAPAWFTTAPVGAIKKLLEKTGWNLNDVDLFEINEAFAVVTLAAMHDLDLPADKVNVHGGACALGHPIGCSGARIIITLIYALQQYQLKRGIAALCIGGGEATAVGIELL